MTSAPSRPRAALSRADLLRVIIAIGEHGLAPIAIMLGYERVASTANAPGTEPKIDPVTDNLTFRTEPPQPPIERPRLLPKAYYYQVTEREQLTPTQRRAETEAPAWLAQTQVLSHDERPDPTQVRIPKRLPLTRWSRLWPFLRAELGHDLPSREIDLTAAMARINRGEVLRRIPRRVRHDWNPRICIVIDYHRPAQPFWEDFNALIHVIARLHGKLGLDVRILVGEMARAPYYRHPLSDTLQRWRTPDPSTAVLILGDLGALAEATAVPRGWAEFGSRLNAAGCRPVVLSPLSVDAHEVRLQRSFRIYQWDRQARLKRGTREVGITDDSAAAELLLTLLAPALVVEPNLLRAMRHLLPAAQAGALAESKVWLHADVYSSAQGFRFASTAAAQKYQQRFSALDAGRRAQAAELIRRHHAALPASVRYAELAVCQRLVPEHVDSAQQQAVQTWQQNIARTSLEYTESLALKNWRGRHVKRQAQFTDPATKALWALDQQDKLARGETVEMPADIALDEVAYFLHNADAQPILCEVSQYGDTLRLSPASIASEQDMLGFSLAKINLRDARAYVAWEGNAEAAQIIQVSQLPRDLLSLPQAAGSMVLRTAEERLSISALTKPGWAQAISRDATGLHTGVNWRRNSCRLTWQPPQTGERFGRWHCSDAPLDVDQYGLFAALSVAEGITQRFRWILPGTFLMGSPETEAERWGDELQHEVTLTQGYWLAETACTQALWHAVTGDNPSEFKDDLRNPVEQVSWDEVQQFIRKLNQRFPNLNACLPTEAQWEYGCRAGTTTPFSFGENITPEQVNYYGDNPYAGGKKGRYRQHTVPVGSLPANAWGLYEMHGNV